MLSGARDYAGYIQDRTLIHDYLANEDLFREVWVGREVVQEDGSSTAVMGTLKPSDLSLTNVGTVTGVVPERANNVKVYEMNWDTFNALPAGEQSRVLQLLEQNSAMPVALSWIERDEHGLPRRDDSGQIIVHDVPPNFYVIRWELPQRRRLEDGSMEEYTVTRYSAVFRDMSIVDQQSYAAFSADYLAALQSGGVGRGVASPTASGRPTDLDTRIAEAEVRTLTVRVTNTGMEGEHQVIPYVNLPSELPEMNRKGYQSATVVETGERVWVISEGSQ